MLERPDSMLEDTLNKISPSMSCKVISGESMLSRDCCNLLTLGANER